MVPACVCKVSYLKKRCFLLKKAHYSGQNHFARILYYQTNKSTEIDRALAVLQYNIEYTHTRYENHAFWRRLRFFLQAGTKLIRLSKRESVEVWAERDKEGPWDLISRYCEGVPCHRSYQLSLPQTAFYLIPFWFSGAKQNQNGEGVGVTRVVGPLLSSGRGKTTCWYVQMLTNNAVN